MAAPYHALYTNHFEHIRCSRPAFLAFLDYTVTAAATGPAAVKALGTALRAVAGTLGGTVVAREGQDGAAQTLTRSRKDVLQAMRVFVQDAHAVHLVPAYRSRPAELAAVLPHGLMHLTEANGTELPVRFEAFAAVLVPRHADLAAGAGAALGTAAAALLAELVAATAAKDAGLKVSKETIGAIGGQWAQACQLLWQVHCTALAAHHAEPARAEAYFNYGLLPRRTGGKAKPKAVPTPNP